MQYMYLLFVVHTVLCKWRKWGEDERYRFESHLLEESRREFQKLTKEEKEEFSDMTDGFKSLGPLTPPMST